MACPNSIFSKILNGMPDGRCGMRHAGWGMRHAGWEMPDAACRMGDAGCGEAGCGIKDTDLGCGCKSEFIKYLICTGHTQLRYHVTSATFVQASYPCGNFSDTSS